MTPSDPTRDPDQHPTLADHERHLVEFGRYMLARDRTPDNTDWAIVGRLAAFVINGIPAVRAAITPPPSLDVEDDRHLGGPESALLLTQSDPTRDIVRLRRVARAALNTWVGRNWPSMEAMRRDGIGAGLVEKNGRPDQAIRRFIDTFQPDFVLDLLDALAPLPTTPTPPQDGLRSWVASHAVRQGKLPSGATVVDAEELDAFLAALAYTEPSE